MSSGFAAKSGFPATESVAYAGMLCSVSTASRIASHACGIAYETSSRACYDSLTVLAGEHTHIEPYFREESRGGGDHVAMWVVRHSREYYVNQ